MGSCVSRIELLAVANGNHKVLRIVVLAAGIVVVCRMTLWDRGGVHDDDLLVLVLLVLLLVEGRDDLHGFSLLLMLANGGTNLMNDVGNCSVNNQRKGLLDDVRCDLADDVRNSLLQDLLCDVLLVQRDGCYWLWFRGYLCRGLCFRDCDGIGLRFGFGNDR